MTMFASLKMIPNYYRDDHDAVGQGGFPVRYPARGWEGDQGCQLLHTLHSVCSTSHTAHHRALCDCDKSAQSRLERTQRIATAGARC